MESPRGEVLGIDGGVEGMGRSGGSGLMKVVGLDIARDEAEGVEHIIAREKEGVKEFIEILGKELVWVRIEDEYWVLPQGLPLQRVYA